jgi:hypothetical protein
MSARSLLVLLLVGLPVLASDPSPRIPDALVRVHDFATLTAAEAAQVEGKRLLFRVQLDSDPAEVDNLVRLMQTASPVRPVAARTVVWASG